MKNRVIAVGVMCVFAGGLLPAQDRPEAGEGGPFGGRRSELRRGEGLRPEGVRGGAAGRPEAMRGEMGSRPADPAMEALDREMGLTRLLGMGRAAEELGVSQETIQKIREQMQALREKEIDLQAQMQKLSLRQASLVSSLMSDRTRKPDESMQLVEEIGAVRTELAKMTIRRLLVVRENLTDEQILKGRELLQQRMERMRGEGGRRGEGDPALREREGGRRDDGATREREGGRRDGERPRRGGEGGGREERRRGGEGPADAL